MTINKKNFRSTLVALTFGALVTVLPASADTISLSIAGMPTNVLVGGYQWTFAPGAVTTTAFPASGVSLDGNTLGSEIGAFSSSGAVAPNTQSEVIDITVTPTLSSGTKAAVTFEGTIQKASDGTFSLYFGNNGTTACTNIAVSCTTTANGNVINNGQTVVATANGNYTVLQSGGIDYEVQTTTSLSPTKPLNYLNGFVGVVNAPEPSTYATTGLAAAFLGMFLRRKKQNS